MKLLRKIILVSIAFMSAQTFAQRATFNASTVRIIDHKEIKKKLTEPAPEQTVERRGKDASGALVVIIATQRFVSFDDVFFKLDSTELRDKSSEKQLDHMVEALTSPELKGKRFLIEGHTCDLGDEDYNFILSAKRAEVIRGYLVKHGVSRERLAILGCGESDPAVKIDLKAASPELEVQRQRNRRVVLRELPPAK